MHDLFVSRSGVVGGARVASRAGEIAIDRLAAGHEVVGLRGLGMVRIDQVSGLATEEPLILIAAHAFGEGRPGRDLLVAPNTPILTRDSGGRGVLVPAHAFDIAATVRTVDGAGEEIWNLIVSEPGGGPQPDAVLVEGLAIGTIGTQADLESGPILAGIRAKLLAQAVRLGWRRTSDVGLHVGIGRHRLHPCEQDGDRYGFDLPEDAGTVAIRSKHVIPATVEAASGDHRRLGVALGAVLLEGRELDLADPRFGRGFYPLEGDLSGLGDGQRWRWTDGEAQLHVGRATRLDLVVSRVMAPWAEPDKAAPLDDRTGGGLTADSFVTA